MPRFFFFAFFPYIRNIAVMQNDFLSVSLPWNMQSTDNWYVNAAKHKNRLIFLQAPIFRNARSNITQDCVMNTMSHSL
jgi:hypothetical protein